MERGRKWRRQWALQLLSRLLPPIFRALKLFFKVFFFSLPSSLQFYKVKRETLFNLIFSNIKRFPSLSIFNHFFTTNNNNKKFVASGHFNISLDVCRHSSTHRESLTPKCHTSTAQTDFRWEIVTRLQSSFHAIRECRFLLFPQWARLISCWWWRRHWQWILQRSLLLLDLESLILKLL